jgi:competence protein ComEA
MSPARSPPAEAIVEQSSPPWRVFDAPTGDRASSSRQAGAQGERSGADAGLGIQPMALLGLVGAAAVALVAVAIAVAGMGGDRVVAGPDVDAAGLASGDPAAGVGLLVIDVSGAVLNPGLYRLPPGSRVGDAVRAAGGYAPRVDAEQAAARLNLAAMLTDGAQVRVPSRDDVGGAAASGAGSAGGGEGASGGGLIDLNRASQSELESLPGIGPVTATKIIAAREEAPFRSVDELRERGLVGEKTFDSLKALVTVG